MILLWIHDIKYHDNRCWSIPKYWDNNIIVNIVIFITQKLWDYYTTSPYLVLCCQFNWYHDVYNYRDISIDNYCSLEFSISPITVLVQWILQATIPSPWIFNFNQSAIYYFLNKSTRIMKQKITIVEILCYENFGLCVRYIDLFMRSICWLHLIFTYNMVELQFNSFVKYYFCKTTIACNLWIQITS